MKELLKVAIFSIIGIFNRDYNTKALEIIQSWNKKKLQKYMILTSSIYLVSMIVAFYFLKEILGY